MTANVFGDLPGSLDYISGSYHAFGNNGTTPEGTSTNQGTNTSINDIIGNGSLSVSTVLHAMNKSLGSDHLPIITELHDRSTRAFDFIACTPWRPRPDSSPAHNRIPIPVSRDAKRSQYVD